MQNIEFTFHKNSSPEQRKDILEKIKTWKSIESAGYLMEDSIDDNIKRMAFAYVTDDAKIEVVSKRLESIPEIESAAIPSRRS